MAANVRITGLMELSAKLKMLASYAEVERISYRGTFGAAKELRNIAADYAPMGNTETAGELRRGFAMKRITKGTKRGYTVGVRAGRTRNKRTPDDPFYWWWLEFGTQHIAPMGFFRRAFALSQTHAPHEIVQAAMKAVLDAGNRAVARFGKGKK